MSEEDMYVRIKDLQSITTNFGTDVQKGPWTKLKQTPPDKALVYLFTMRPTSKHQTYFYLKTVLEQCTPLEFKWCMKIIGNRNSLREIVPMEVTDGK